MRFRNKVTVLLVSLFMTLAIGVCRVTARDIQVSGEPIGADAEGNAIYQIHSNGIKIGYKLIGSGDPLVLIVGLGNTMDLWPKEVIDVLSEKYQLILLDNRGMGHSTANDETFTYALFADDVIGLLDTLQVEKAHVLGFSMGSVITQELLLLYPHRFKKAVIYATSADGSNVVAALEGKAPSDPSSINPIVLRQVEATTRWKTPLDQAAGITNPVMFLVGTSDTVVGTESSKTLASAVPGAWLVQFKNGSHQLVLEAPAEFARIVLAFLDLNETVGAE